MKTCKIVFLLSLSFLATTARSQWVRTAGPARSNIGSLLAVEIPEEGTSVYAGTVDSSLFRTTDNGASWVQANTGLPPIDTTFQGSGSIPSLGVMGGDLYAGTSEFGIYRSTNQGATWSAVNSGFGTPYVFAIAARGTTLLAGDDGLGLFRSTDNGSSWAAADSGFPPTHSVLSLAVNGSIIYAGTIDVGVLRSLDDGLTWGHTGIGLSSFSIPRLITTGSVIFASGYDGNMYRSNDSGATWTLLNNNISPTGQSAKVGHMIVSGRELFAATAIMDDSGNYQNGVSISYDSGNTWRDASQGLPSAGAEVWSFAVSSKYLFAGLADNYVWRRPLAEFAGVNDDNANRSSTAISESYPNPFTIKTTIPFSLTHAEHASLNIFDILGHEIATLADQDFEAGPHEIEWVAGDAMPGVYYCRVATADGVQSRALVLAK